MLSEDETYLSRSPLVPARRRDGPCDQTGESLLPAKGSSVDLEACGQEITNLGSEIASTFFRLLDMNA